jgi:hypothetical protein
MPDTHAAICADLLVKASPGWQMRVHFIAGKCFQILK